MRRLVVWNLMTLDGYFEGRNPWDLDFHEAVWGDELKTFSLEQGEEIGTPVEMVTRRLRTDGDERGMLVYGYKFRPRLPAAS